MSTKIRGCAGSIKVGSTPNAVGGVSEFSLTITEDMDDTTSLDSGCWGEQSGTLKRWSGSVNFFLDPDDVGQAELFTTITAGGTPIDVELYVNGEATPGTSYTGSVILSDVNFTNTTGSIVTGTASFTGTGALTITDLA